MAIYHRLFLEYSNENRWSRNFGILKKEKKRNGSIDVDAFWKGASRRKDLPATFDHAYRRDKGSPRVKAWWNAPIVPESKRLSSFESRSTFPARGSQNYFPSGIASSEKRHRQHGVWVIRFETLKTEVEERTRYDVRWMEDHRENDKGANTWFLIISCSRPERNITERGQIS